MFVTINHVRACLQNICWVQFKDNQVIFKIILGYAMHSAIETVSLSSKWVHFASLETCSKWYIRPLRTTITVRATTLSFIVWFGPKNRVSLVKRVCACVCHSDSVTLFFYCCNLNLCTKCTVSVRDMEKSNIYTENTSYRESQARGRFVWYSNLTHLLLQRVWTRK